jgi:adenosine deaminase
VPLALFLLAPLLALGQATAGPRPATAEERTARYFESIRKNPVALRAFLRALPKGGDLHNHLSGAIYAESYLRWAAEDALCVETKTLTITGDREPCDAGKGQRAAKEASQDPSFYDSLVDALSTRRHHPAHTAGEYQFFAVFDRFGPLTRSRRGDMLAEVARRAATQNVAYLELTNTWGRPGTFDAASKVDWTDDLALLRERLLEAGLREASRTAELDAAETRMKEVLGCGSAAPDPGCGIVIRHQAASYRAQAPVRTFAMLVWSFLQSEADPRFVGINLVQPEDWHVAVRDYDLHMEMIAFLRRLHPRVNVSLHAGELALGQVPPEVLGTHVEKAIRIAGAQRIGHGSDIAYHPRPQALMEEMKRKGVAVEISLSSSDIILGLHGEKHPLRAFVAAGVPVVIATDDEGVARSDLTNEYLRAAVEHGLGYRELKRISRDSLRYAFLEATEKQRLLERLDLAIARFEGGDAWR